MKYIDNNEFSIDKLPASSKSLWNIDPTKWRTMSYENVLKEKIQLSKLIIEEEIDNVENKKYKNADNQLINKYTKIINHNKALLEELQ